MHTPIIANTCDQGKSERLGVVDSTLFLKRPLYNHLLTLQTLPLITYPVTAEARETLLNTADALILSGSIYDIPPQMYGEETLPECGAVLEERSNMEAALLQDALERNMPILGICGGFQLINVALGGTLYQDYTLRQKVLETLNHTQPFNHHQPYHEVTVKNGSLLHLITGCDKLKVNSTHHQLIKDIAPALIPLAVAQDGVIEALGLKERANLLCLEWHPEYLAADDPAELAILRWLRDKAAAYAATRGK